LKKGELLLCHGEVSASLRNEDLHLSIFKVNWEFATGDLEAVSCEEDIADSLSLSKASVGNISVLLTINLVGKCNEEISSSEGVEGII
jgi:hypothetical protein